MASEAGAKSKFPAKSRARAKVSLSKTAYKSLRKVLYDCNRSGLIASDSSHARLRSWLSREAAGSSADLRSPLWSSRKGSSRTWVPREKLVESFSSKISKVALEDKYLSDLLHEIEESQLSNISAQSPYLPWEKDGPEKVAEVYRDKPTPRELNQRALERAVDRVISLLPTNSVRMESIDYVVSRQRVNPHAVDQPGMDTHTNSGPPYFVNPWKPSERTDKERQAESQAAFDYIIRRSKLAQNALMKGDTVTWNAIVAKRLAQKSKVEKRKRIVIALEKAEPVIWKTFTPQLQEALKEVKMPGGVRPFVAWNDLPQIDLDCQLALNVAHKANRIVIGGDYSSYDATLGPWLIKLAGSIVGKWIFKGEKLVTALAESMSSHVKLITPDRIWEPQPASMKSGSGGTNLLDSIANLLVMFYGEEIGAYKLVNCAVQGDDFILDGVGCEPEVIHEVAGQFGLLAHPDKQMYKRHALAFLQRIHYRGMLGGIASVGRTLGSCMSYERMAYRPEEWSAWVDIVRILSQLENCSFSPYFETLVDFVKDGDKYHLGAHLSPSAVLSQAGDTGKDWIQRERGKPNKSRDASDDGLNGFERMAVNGVLRGEVLPPLGSEARFSRVYGTRA